MYISLQNFGTTPEVSEIVCFEVTTIETFM